MRKIIFLMLMVCTAVGFAACGNVKDKNKYEKVYEQFEGDRYKKCSDIEGKTVGELEEEGYYFSGVDYLDNKTDDLKYYFIFEKGNFYYIILDDSATEIVEKKLEGKMSHNDRVSVFEDCVVQRAYEEIESSKKYDLYAVFESDKYTECSDLVGKTVGELTDKGYSCIYHQSMNRQHYFTFRDDSYKYNVILDDSVIDIMNNLDFNTSIEETLPMLKDCVVEKCYSESKEKE